jgi:Protein of unknown function (DUF2892)
VKKNIGTSGRIFRLIIAIALLAFAWWEKSWIALALSLFVFFEVFASWCILYQILGINACPLDQNKK